MKQIKTIEDAYHAIRAKGAELAGRSADAGRQLSEKERAVAQEIFAIAGDLHQRIENGEGEKSIHGDGNLMTALTRFSALIAGVGMDGSPLEGDWVAPGGQVIKSVTKDASRRVKEWRHGEPHPWAAKIADHPMVKGMGGRVKAFTMPSGSIEVLPLSQSPVILGRPGGELLAAINVQEWPGGLSTADAGFGADQPGLSPAGVIYGPGRTVDIAVQTARTNNAAFCDRGTGGGGSDVDKPTSDFTWEIQAFNAEWVGHLAQPIRIEDLEDLSFFNTWLAMEMQWGLIVAIENAVVNANQGLPSRVGILHAAGTNAVAFRNDMMTTISDAVTLLTSKGYGDLQVALSLDDWQEISLMCDDLGRYLFPEFQNPPGSQSLFGAPVLRNNQVPQGTAIVAPLRQAVTVAERSQATITWGVTETATFAQNNVAARCEQRVAIAVTAPDRIAIATLTGS